MAIKASASTHRLHSSVTALLPCLRKHRLEVPVLEVDSTVLDFKRAVLASLKKEMDMISPGDDSQFAYSEVPRG